MFLIDCRDGLFTKSCCLGVLFPDKFLGHFSTSRKGEKRSEGVHPDLGLDHRFGLSPIHGIWSTGSWDEDKGQAGPSGLDMEPGWYFESGSISGSIYS